MTGQKPKLSPLEKLVVGIIVIGTASWAVFILSNLWKILF